MISFDSLFFISVVAGAQEKVQDKAQDLSNKTQDAANDVQASAQQKKPVGVVKNVRSLAASVVGTVQKLVTFFLPSFSFVEYFELTCFDILFF